jgi:hypothetical protein
MGRISRIGLFSLGCALLACGKGKPSEATPPARRTAAAPAPAAVAESIYDAQGRLKASSEQVEWLQIPAGFSRKPSTDERHVRFESPTLPIDKVRDFLAARMFTGSVDEAPYHISYRAVMPLDNDPKAVRLDILVAARPALHTVVLEIERLTYGDAKPLTVDEARRVLAREQAQAE